MAARAHRTLAGAAGLAYDAKWVVEGSNHVLRGMGLPFACALGAVLAPNVAWADVMEVGAQGYSWVAGGPARTALPSEAPPALAGALADPEDDGPAGESHAQSLTEVGPSAGPAQWQARVAELAAKYDISPSLLEAVVWQESRWNVGAVSRVGARGLSQLMPATARQLGVDAQDPGANLEGGARYLRLQLDAFEGDIEKALAAYNAGPARVARAGGIPAIRETQDYVTAILARLSQPVRR